MRLALGVFAATASCALLLAGSVEADPVASIAPTSTRPGAEVVVSGHAWDTAWSICPGRSLSVTFDQGSPIRLGEVSPWVIAPFTGGFSARVRIPASAQPGRAFIELRQAGRRYQFPGCVDYSAGPLRIPIHIVASTPLVIGPEPALRIESTSWSLDDPTLPEASFPVTSPCPLPPCEAPPPMPPPFLYPGAAAAVWGLAWDLPESCPQGVTLTLVDHSGTSFPAGRATVPVTGHFRHVFRVPLRGATPGVAAIMAAGDGTGACAIRKSALFTILARVPFLQAGQVAGVGVSLTGGGWRTDRCDGAVALSAAVPGGAAVLVARVKPGNRGEFRAQVTLPASISGAVTLSARQRSFVELSDVGVRSRCLPVRERDATAKSRPVRVVAPPTPPGEPPAPTPQPTTTTIETTTTIPTTTPTPPGPKKPQCSDGKDNDGDGAIDYPADKQCKSPDDNDESV